MKKSKKVELIDDLVIIYNGGCLGSYEYNATYNGRKETLITSVKPEETKLLRWVFSDIFRDIENGQSE